MRYLTNEEIESARQPDLLTFLQRYDPGELIPVGAGAYKLKTHSSLKISNGKWYWWSHGKLGGKNALEYLIKVKNMDFIEAVQLVNQPCGFLFRQGRHLLQTKELFAERTKIMNLACPYETATTQSD